MKQIVDKLNEIAKAIDESVELPDTGLITDSLDAITKAFGGTPNDSNLIVDKLDDIAGVASGGGGGDYGDLRWVIPIQECTLTGEETEPNIETINNNIQDYQQSIIVNMYYTEDGVDYCDSYVCFYDSIDDDEFYYEYHDDMNLLDVYIGNGAGSFWFGTPDRQTVFDGNYTISAVGIHKFTADDGGGGGIQ